MPRPSLLTPLFGLPADVRRAAGLAFASGLSIPDETFDRITAQLHLGGPMKTVTYIGPFPEVEFQQGDLWRKAKNGEPIDVPDDLAERMVEQTDNWAAAKPAPKKTAPKTTAPEEG